MTTTTTRSHADMMKSWREKNANAPAPKDTITLIASYTSACEFGYEDKKCVCLSVIDGYGYKDQLKASGFSWNAGDKHWDIWIRKNEGLPAIFDEIPHKFLFGEQYIKEED